MIQVMIVDDERHAREALGRMIQKTGDFEILAQASSGDEALEMLKTARPQVLFLDVEMPGTNGLEVAGQLSRFDTPPLVVFATAYDQYALNAFETHAVDYVLKPYEPERLNKTFQRIRETLESRKSQQKNLAALENQMIAAGKIKRLVGYRFQSKARIVVDPRDVYYFEVKHGSVIAHLLNEDLTVRTTLSEILSHLDPAEFAQTHKAYVVNLSKVHSVEPMFNSNYELILRDLTRVRVPLSRKFVPEIKELLGGW